MKSTICLDLWPYIKEVESSGTLGGNYMWALEESISNTIIKTHGLLRLYTMHTSQQLQLLIVFDWFNDSTNCAFKTGNGRVAPAFCWKDEWLSPNTLLRGSHCIFAIGNFYPVLSKRTDPEIPWIPYSLHTSRFRSHHCVSTPLMFLYSTWSLT